MKRKLYYIENETMDRAVYEDMGAQRYEVVENAGGKKTILTLPEHKDVTGEYEYVYIPREMSMAQIQQGCEVTRHCPMCGKNTSIHLNREELDHYSWYTDTRFGGSGSRRPAPHIQKLFPQRTKEERELLMSGYCYSCQEILFGLDEFILTTDAEFPMGRDRLVAYNRADHDGYHWWNTWFPKNGTGGNPDMEEEMEKFSAYILTDQLGKGISDIPKLGEFYAAEPTKDQEYHLYCEGTYCNYEVKLINREKDYNVYIYVYKIVEEE